jgi:hypothetical protein
VVAQIPPDAARSLRQMPTVGRSGPGAVSLICKPGPRFGATFATVRTIESDDIGGRVSRCVSVGLGVPSINAQSPRQHPPEASKHRIRRTKLVKVRLQMPGREESSVWMNLVVIVVLLVGVYGFARLAGFRTKRLSSHTDRTAETIYGNYADSQSEQERFADRHGGSWRVDNPPRDTREP